MKEPSLRAKIETFRQSARYLAMTFLIEAHKDGKDASTIRALVPDAVLAARQWINRGWTVSVTCPEGGRYWPEQFDLLLWKYAEMPDIPRYSVAERAIKTEVRGARGIETPANAKLSK